MADEDEEISLSASTLEALQSFYADRDAHAQQFAKLQTEAEEQHEGKQSLSMDVFTEDWNESQFWYSDETASLLAKELMDGATEDTVIAVVSAPSVFVALKNLITSTRAASLRPKLILLEHDSRFSVFPEFVFYDFARPVQLPAHLKGTVDHIICDPPFLSEDCQTKAALTVRWLSKGPTTDAKADGRRLIVCTGERMESLVTKLYRPFGVQTTDYEPKHARGLSNEFYCYANFESNHWKWKAP